MIRFSFNKGMSGKLSRILVATGFAVLVLGLFITGFIKKDIRVLLTSSTSYLLAALQLPLHGSTEGRIKGRLCHYGEKSGAKAPLAHASTRATTARTALILTGFVIHSSMPHERPCHGPQGSACRHTDNDHIVSPGHLAKARGCLNPSILGIWQSMNTTPHLPSAHISKA